MTSLILVHWTVQGRRDPDGAASLLPQAALPLLPLQPGGQGLQTGLLAEIASKKPLYNTLED